MLFSYLIFMVGIGVFAVYAIWNDAYLTGNDSKRSSIILFTIIGLVNVIIGISNYFNSHGDKFVYTVNFFVAGLLLICVATFIAKDIFKKDEED